MTPMPDSPANGQRVWRSLDEGADSPEFDAWVEREFPAGAAEFRDPVSRRHFVRIMAASFLLAGLGATGCRRPEEKAFPPGAPKDGPGRIEYFATAMPQGRFAIPLTVKSFDGRPIKIEGNARVPGSNGGTNAIAQASVLDLYDPDRAREFRENGQPRSPKQAEAFLEHLNLGDGTGTAILAEPAESPSRQRLRSVLAERRPGLRWFEMEDSLSPSIRLLSALYRNTVRPEYRLDRASVILSLDADFLGGSDSDYLQIRRFAEGRQPSGGRPMSRLYVAESLMTLTGANADHRLAVRSSRMTAVAARLAMEVLGDRAAVFGEPLRQWAAETRDVESWIVACAKDLLANPGRALIVPGERLSATAQMLVAAMNEALGATSGPEPCCALIPCAAPDLDAKALALALRGNEVKTLIILGGNPAYSLPADIDWREAQNRAQTVIRLGAYFDETAWREGSRVKTHWDFPAAHYLESWGDARSADGFLLPIQPLIEPLFGGWSELELLARLAGVELPFPRDLIFETFGRSESEWNRFLSEGWQTDPAAAPVQCLFAWNEAARRLKPPPISNTSSINNAVDLVFYHDSKVGDGRGANNGWLQELPDPITKLTWDNVILMSPATAQALNAMPQSAPDSGSPLACVVQVEYQGRKLRGPAWPQPGMPDNVFGLALGYGRECAGRVGTGVGFNANAIRISEGNTAVADRVLRIDATHPLSITQSHWAVENRDGDNPVRERSLAELQSSPEPRAKQEKPDSAALYPNPLDAVAARIRPQWGMAIDLNRCVGCSACVIACQSENNIPIVGKEMVGKSREMHWLRIDRYYLGATDAPAVAFQPMLCQHCETAPCENVCPTGATTHTEEGLNAMTYNRCIGSRYCSNNCPFKVRRFNFFDYNRRALESLRENPAIHGASGDEDELARLSKNPDVSVRMRGVMEKCSFCLQRIEQARIAWRTQAGDGDPARAPFPEVKTACQQACPASAIVFGDISDPQSPVAKAMADPRAYTLFARLNLKPRAAYLEKIRNPSRGLTAC